MSEKCEFEIVRITSQGNFTDTCDKKVAGSLNGKTYCRKHLQQVLGKFREKAKK